MLSGVVVSATTLVANPNYVCRRPNGKAQSIDGRTVTEVDVNGTILDVEGIFCSLGEMLCTGEVCDSTIAARCCMA